MAYAALCLRLPPLQDGPFLSSRPGTTAALARHWSLGLRNTLPQCIHEIDHFGRSWPFFSSSGKRRVLLLCLDELAQCNFIIILERVEIERMRIGLDELRGHGELLFIDMYSRAAGICEKYSPLSRNSSP